MKKIIVFLALTILTMHSKAQDNHAKQIEYFTLPVSVSADDLFPALPLSSIKTINWGDGTIDNSFKHKYTKQGYYKLIASLFSNPEFHAYDMVDIVINKPIIIDDIKDLSELDRSGLSKLFDSDIYTPIISGTNFEITSLKSINANSVDFYFEWLVSTPDSHIPSIYIFDKNGVPSGRDFICYKSSGVTNICKAKTDNEISSIYIRTPYGLSLTEIIFK